jgi:hypothetical protein
LEQIGGLMNRFMEMEITMKRALEEKKRTFVSTAASKKYVKISA